MALFKKTGTGNFNEVINKLHEEIISSGLSVKLEEESKFSNNSSKLITRVYERYSFSGSNRLSLTLVLLESENILDLTLITAGGSRAIFFKVNRMGENNFLNDIKPLANKLIK